MNCKPSNMIRSCRRQPFAASAVVCPGTWLAVRENSELYFSFAASGFRDFTRIAASHPEMWRDICLANRVSLLKELDRYRAELDGLRAVLEQGDGAALEKTFDVARTARRTWAEGKVK